MAKGKPYDDVCAMAKELAEAEGALLVIFNGKEGHGFSAQLPVGKIWAVAPILKEIAAAIERDPEGARAVLGAEGTLAAEPVSRELDMTVISAQKCGPGGAERFCEKLAALLINWLPELEPEYEPEETLRERIRGQIDRIAGVLFESMKGMGVEGIVSSDRHLPFRSERTH